MLILGKRLKFLLFLFYDSKIQMLFQEKTAGFQVIVLQGVSRGCRKSEKCLGFCLLALGCVDAFNVDGGTFCGMYYNGSYLATPGREIPVTLQVFVD